jgi:hypothetical protein
LIQFKLSTFLWIQPMIFRKLIGDQFTVYSKGHACKRTPGMPV